MIEKLERIDVLLTAIAAMTDVIDKEAKSDVSRLWSDVQSLLVEVKHDYQEDVEKVIEPISHAGQVWLAEMTACTDEELRQMELNFRRFATIAEEDGEVDFLPLPYRRYKDNQWAYLADIVNSYRVYKGNGLLNIHES